jgi:hypothetical protein
MLLFSMALLFGCGKKTIEDTTGDKQFKEKQFINYEETKDNIHFNIKVNQKSFDLNDEIIVEATVTNKRNESIEYYAGSLSCISHLGVQIISKENNRYLPQKPPEEPKDCTDDVHTERLEPQETVQEKVVFLPKEHIQSSEEPAFGGTYDVVVMFHPEGSSWEEAIKVTTQITIVGTNKDIISKEKAEQVTNNHKKVQEWVKNHSGDKIAKVENDEYFLLWYDGWDKTNKQEFERLKQGIYQEEKQILFVDGTWEVTYLSKLGPSPNGIKIVVDANSKEVLSVKTFER